MCVCSDPTVAKGADDLVVHQADLDFPVALQKAVEKYGVSRIFTFHGSVAAARSFTSGDGEGIRNHLPAFTTLHVSGEMATARREDQMKAFRQAEKAVMSNARCLTEGVDVPAVDMVAFISPRKSKVDIVQATGRAMRKSPGKEFGYVMVPLFVEQAANESIEEALHRTGFSDAWDLLGAMREQDDVLTDIIREMREDKGRTGGYDESRFSERVEVLGPSVSLNTIRESITAECLESLGTSWDERFGELLAYKAEYGDVNVPHRWSTNLGYWLGTQRSAWKRGELSPDRKKRLVKLGFELIPFQAQWDEMFCELLAYKVEHGHVNVPVNGSSPLCIWVTRQRVAHIPVETLIHEHQQEYYAALNRSTQDSDSAAFIEFMLQMILDAAPRAQSKAQSGAQSESILHALAPGPLSATELIAHLKLRSKTGAFKRAIKALLDDGLIEYTLPDKPNSRLQKYRLTGKGQAMPSAVMAQA